MDLSKLTPAKYSTQTAENDLSKHYANQKSPLDHYNTAYGNLGVGTAQAGVNKDKQRIDDTYNLIDAVAPSVQGRTSNSLTTDAQRQGLITKETTPLYDGLGNLSRAYDTSSANLNSLLAQAQNQGNLAYQGQQSQLEALLQRLDQAKWWEQMANSGGSGGGSDLASVLDYLAGGGGFGDEAYEEDLYNMLRAQQVVPERINAQNIIQSGDDAYKTGTLGTIYNSGAINTAALGLNTNGLNYNYKPSNSSKGSVRVGKVPTKGKTKGAGSVRLGSF